LHSLAAKTKQYCQVFAGMRSERIIFEEAFEKMPVHVGIKLATAHQTTQVATNYISRKSSFY
jgi:hypothetical protein